MKALYYDQFTAPIRLENLPDPAPPHDGVAIRVKATGLCRSDWHGWMGHDADIALPHVPGHELAGIVESAGPGVSRFKPGDRVTLPFCMGCGHCVQCAHGDQQICDRYFQPGFTGWGSFAEYVAVPYADQNLVRLPEEIGFVEAAILGCRFITAFRGLIHQGRLQPGEWVAVHGCGGVGLSAVMIAKAAGARVVAVDISPEKLDFARRIGADHLVNARSVNAVPEAVWDLTQGGAHLSVDAFGGQETCFNSIASLRKRGRHIQLGLLAGEHNTAVVPMGAVISRELEIYGSHGMQAHRYPEMLNLILEGKLQPARLLGKTIGLEAAAGELMSMGNSPGTGVTVVEV